MALPTACANQKRLKQPSSSDAFLKALPKRSEVFKPKSGIEASLKEKAVRGVTAATLTTSMVIPEVAQAAGSDISPSLNNFLLSVFAGGVVLAAILGAVIGVSNFDPVKRT
ncbi:ultraviolet-B-repressible protein [Senna tora]|uniref:Ultraviolet-B-repressible protein n=1 Tax=Senna tora TaxID=362788 RepID=A0A834WDU7_9FABA|nr:ultraviolet-B-repressible protein [Senna tora]